MTNIIKNWELSGNFTTRLFKHASKSLAELIITAWINAGSPNSLTNINDFIEKINSFQLYQNYPNPFNPTTTIKYSVPNEGTSLMKFLQLKVYDVLGNEVATLVNEYKSSGTYEVVFNPESSIKNPASGIYFYQLKAGNYVQTRKMVLLK